MILAVDPGNVESAYVVVDSDLRPFEFAKLPNADIRHIVHTWLKRGVTLYVEMIGHYGTGMPAGETVFDTCRMIGRLEQIADEFGLPVELVKRGPIKLHLCGATAKAKDGNVRQALIDRFGDKGTKAKPGWFYGFRADIWQAYALAVYAADKLREEAA